jgi:tRNA pseudouridine55 synthase
MVSDGLLLADKGPAVTSFQVVAHLRRVLRVPKVGHGGTLDPMATGLLPILLGEATKLTGHLQGQDKEYLATIRLGIATDTLERPAP